MYLDILKKRDKEGQRISAKDQDILELENNLNVGIVDNCLKSEGFNHFEPEEDEEEKMEEKLSMERKRKTTLNNLKKKRLTGMMKQEELTYISNNNFLKGKAVLAVNPYSINIRKRKDDAIRAAFNGSQSVLQGNGGMADRSNLALESFLTGSGSILNERSITFQAGFNQGSHDGISLDDSDLAFSELNESLVKVKGFKVTKLDALRHKDKQAIIEYLIQNRLVMNNVVRSYEIETILYRNFFERGFKSFTPPQKLLAVVVIPIRVMSYLTILPTNEKNYSKMRFILNPIFSSALLCLCLTDIEDIGMEASMGILIMGLVLFLIFLVFLDPDNPPEGRFKQMTVTISFVASVLWIAILGNIAVSFINSLSVVYNLSYPFMMVVVFSPLSWIPSTLSTIRLVRFMKTMPTLSTTIFTSYLIFGLSLALQTLLNGNSQIEIWLQTTRPKDLYFFLVLCSPPLIFITLGSTLFMLNWRYNRFIGVALLSVYFLILTGFILLSIKN